MISISNIGNSVIIETDAHSIQFPKNAIILTSENDSKSVNIKLIASRKVIESFDCEELGYSTAEEAVRDITNKYL